MTMLFLTDFADLAVVLPLAVAVAAGLFATGWRRGALAWAVVVPATWFAVLIAKMTIAACGSPLLFHGLRSPSGHTASAAVVYGGLLGLLLPDAADRKLRALAAMLLAGGFALLFGLSRLALHVHTRSDVAVGAAFGMAGALLLERLAGPRPRPLRVALPLAAALMMVLLFHGQHLRAEEKIDHMARIVWPLTLCCRHP